MLATKKDVMDIVVRSHKELTTKFVLPAMSILSLVFYINYFVWEMFKIFVIAQAFVCAAVNIFMTAKERKFSLLGKQYSTRDDTVDMVRWMFNLAICDVIIMVGMRPDPTGMALTWLVLIFSAQADTFGGRYRNATCAVGFAAFLATFVGIHGANLSTLTIVMASIVLLIFLLVFRRMEKYWVDSMAQALAHQRNEADARAAADRMKAEAMIGFHARTISHELNNMVMVVDLHAAGGGENALPAVRQAVKKITKLNTLVLGAHKQLNKHKEMSLAQLFSDVQILIRKTVEMQQIQFVVELPQDLEQRAFSERDGASYFIIHNLVKNALESFDASRPVRTGKITLRVEAIGEDRARLSVEDNGRGMTSEQLSDLLSGRLSTTKETGHGLGSQFVVAESKRNGFALGGRSDVGVGTAIWIDVPLSSGATAEALKPAG